MATADVVFTFSFVTWEVAAGRGWYMPDDRLALTLLESDRVGRLLVCNRYKSRVVRLLEGRDGTEPAFPSDDRRELISPLRLRRSDPTGPSSTLARTWRRYDDILRRAAERRGLRDPVVITAHPLVAGFGDFTWARSVTYYAVDDWAVHPTYEEYWPAYEEAYARMRERGCRVAAVSAGILDHIAPTGPSLVVPNGLEPAEWGGRQLPASLARGRRPLLVYAGSLGSRLDVSALLKVARELPEARILLVGPVADPDHLAPLRAAPNVELHPPLSRADVANLIRSADVGLVPHLPSPLTATMSPLKVFEYLAGGLPVAAVDLPPMRGIDDRVVLARDGDGFLDAVRTALARGRAPESERQAFVKANSWSARHDRLLDLAFAPAGQAAFAEARAA